MNLPNNQKMICWIWYFLVQQAQRPFLKIGIRTMFFSKRASLLLYVYYLCWAIVNTRGIIDEMIRSKETVHVTYLLTFNIYLCKYVSTSSWQVIFYTMKKLENLELVPTFSIFSLSFIHDNFMHYKKTCNSTFLWNDVGNIKKTLCVIHLRFFFFIKV